jgi:hypothetical protein
MATNKKITELTELVEADLANDDVLAIVDVSAGETFKVRKSTLASALAGVATLGATTPVAVDQATGSVTISLSTVPITSGGTGATSAGAALTALGGFGDPLTTRGDIITKTASATDRLAIGSANTVLTTDGTDPAWSTVTNAMLAGSIDLTSKVTGALPLANGGTNATSASAARTSLGLGTIATQASNSVAITGGAVTGITDITVADGGTGASSASAARTNLGVAIGSDVAAYNADTLFADVSDNLTAGYSSDFEAIGNSGTGTQTLEISTAKENLKTLTINGSFTLAPQTVNSVIAVIATNDGTGGYTITTSGFDKVSGTYNNSASAKHLMRSTVIDGTQVLEILEIA